VSSHGSAWTDSMRLTCGAHPCWAGKVGRTGMGMPYYFSILKALGDDVNLGWMCLTELAKVVGWSVTVSEIHE